jgi:hypothetical protein
MKNLRENPLVWLYNTPKNDFKDIVSTIDSILMKLGYEIRTLILSSKYDLLDVIESRSFKSFNYDKQELGENIYSFKLYKKIRGRKKVRESRFIIFKHTNPFIYILITHEKYKVFHYDIISFINRFYPKIARSYIDSQYMKTIFHNLEKTIEDVSIRITRVSTQSRITNKEARKHYATDIKWTDISYEEMFQNVEENDEWIKSIYFTFIETEGVISTKKKDLLDVVCQISRTGVFKCNKLLTFFYETIVKDIVNKAIDDLNLLNNRQRKKEEKFKPKPIVIEYKIDLFKDSSQNKRLIEVLQGIPYSSLSVSHSNPYLNCSYVDFKDGSSYDVWILSNNEITIIPQMRSTYASLERLSHHIFIGLREGTIKNYTT